MVSSVSSGQVLGDRYRILEDLGQHRFGNTYLVEDTHSDGAQRAIVEFALRIHGSGAWERAVELFEREAALVRTLDHPQLPKFHELFFSYEDGSERVFWVEDYLPGQSLQALIEARWVQQRRFSEQEGADLLRRLLPVLDYLHSCGIIHRNLSPASILLNASERSPALHDFGGIKQVVLTLESEFASPAARPRLGQQAAHLGEPGYAPPEQREKGIVYTYSDLYALAMTVLVMVTGERPDQLNAAQIRRSRRSSRLLPILAPALATQPSDRYQTAAEFLHALDGIHFSETAPPATGRTALPAAGTPKRSGLAFGWLLQACLTLGFVTGAAALGWWVGNLWLGRQLRQPEVVEVPDLELSPSLPPDAGRPPEQLSFPPADDPEPEPPAELPATERQRRLALRDRRRALAIDYETYRQLSDQLHWAQYPDRQGQRPTTDPGEAKLRADYDEKARQLLEQLSQLSTEARAGLGRYRPADRDRWQREAQALGLPGAAFEGLVMAAFNQRFPAQRGAAIGDLVQQPLGQVWHAIALDSLTALRSEQNRTALVLPAGRNTLQAEGALEAGASHVFTALLGENQWVALTVLTNEQPLQLAVYTPNGQRLNENPAERAWSGSLPEAGRYAIVITSQSAQPLDYQLSFTAKNP